MSRTPATATTAIQTVVEDMPDEVGCVPLAADVDAAAPRVRLGRLHELERTTAVLLLWGPEAGSDVLRAYRDFMESAPDEVGGGALYLTAPELPFVPQHLIGKLALAVLVLYTGTEAEARRALDARPGRPPRAHAREVAA